MSINHDCRAMPLGHARALGLLLCALAAGCRTAPGDDGRAPDARNLRLAHIFADHAVLQRDMPLPVWGWAEPGGLVEVSLDGGAPLRAVADASRRWQVTFPAHPADGAEQHVLTVAGATTNTVSDLVFGEVWLCTGQSNMQFNLKDAENAAEAIPAATDPRLRMCLVRGEVARHPTPDYHHGTWEVATPAAVSNWTAVGYFFARDLMEHFDCPVGILEAYEGGTRIEAWTGEEALARFPFKARDLAELDTLADGDLGARYVQYNSLMSNYTAAAEAIISLETNAEHLASLSSPALDDSSWDSITAPGAWERAASRYRDFNGEAWYRRQIEIPESWAGRDLALSLGRIDDIDTAFFDGAEVGRTGSMVANDRNRHGDARLYTVPAALVKGSPATLAIRVFDIAGMGGLMAHPRDFWIAPADGSGDASERLPLAGEWRFLAAAELPMAPANPNNPNLACAFYNTFIHPLAPLALRGVIWYQGESNAGNAWEYRDLFPAMIRCWRARWGRDVPFLWAQLSSLGWPNNQPVDSDWAVVREAQSRALALPATAQVVTIDVGDARDIHPRNKLTVGQRFALAARKVAYGEKIVHSGPTFAGMKIKGDIVRLRFANCDGGLVAKGGAPLKRFAIAGEDQRFVWGEASIEGDTVVVRSPEVPRPVAVRYAWQTNPDGANLYNAEGLPTSPFRTDAWPVATQPD